MSRDVTQSNPAADAAPSNTTDAVCLVGLGYVGLPLAVAFDVAGYDVVGFDVDDDKVGSLQTDVDPTATVGDDAIARCDVEFTLDAEAIGSADYVVIAVPTPVTDARRPDLSYVEAAGRTVGAELGRETTVVLESTVYPGATEEVLVPALEAASGYTAGEQFHVAYSPERATAGDAEHGLQDVVKVVSAFEEDVLENVAALYESVVDAGVCRAPDVRTAEAAKCVENIQRDVNIALVNELAMAFDHLDLDTGSVLDVARTKWNFHDYRPGLVGGHCIPVDPYHFLDRVERAGYTPALIRTGREVNNAVSSHVRRLLAEAVSEAGRSLSESRVLVLGLTYKPDVPDVSSTAIGDVVDELWDAGATVVAHDPHADDEVLRKTFGVGTTPHVQFHGFDAVVVLTPHSAYRSLSLSEMARQMDSDPVLVDAEGLFDAASARAVGFTYRSL